MAQSISALTETTDKVKAFSVGGVDYISKPFQFEEVNARVETHLKIRALQRQLSAQNENLERLVAERTKELAKANERLLELGRIKVDFLGMISHELRTPANGVLGIAELIIDLCSASEDRNIYSDLFRESSLRMQNLIRRPLKPDYYNPFFRMLAHTPPSRSWGNNSEECDLRQLTRKNLPGRMRSKKIINMDRQDEQDKRHKTAKVQLFYPVYPVYPC